MTCVHLRNFCWNKIVTFDKEVRSEFNGIEVGRRPLSLLSMWMDFERGPWRYPWSQELLPGGIMAEI